MNKHKVLILAAAVMLVAATSAYGYHEQWTGWFNQGTLTCNSYNYTRNASGGYIDDETNGSNDDFYNVEDICVAFVCSTLNDTIYLGVKDVSGSKPTGRTGTQDGSGDWSGNAVRRKNTVEQTWLNVTGNWDTEGNKCFDYGQSPATYTANWAVDPTTTLGGGGTSSGYCNDYDP